jgi:hypothetical protein
VRRRHGVLAIGATALNVQGPAVFSRSGVLTIAAGKSSATQTGVALTSASLVLATLQQDRSGVWVRSAVPNVTGSSFTVHLSKAGDSEHHRGVVRGELRTPGQVGGVGLI